MATLGTAGGASPLTLPAAGVTILVDVAFLAQLQLRLAYDIAVLYRVPIDVSDPDDLWKLIRVAFSIKSGEVISEGALKAVPIFIRPLIKRFFSGAVLTTAKGLPFVGKFLLQRNVIKIAIPGVGIPLAVGLNQWTTRVVGRHAREVFRNEARVIELAERLSERSHHPQLMLWVAWLIIMADQKISDDEALLIRHLMRLVQDRHRIVDEQLTRVIDVDPSEVWRRLDAEPGELSDIRDAATRVAAVDGSINAAERAVLSELDERSTRA